MPSAELATALSVVIPAHNSEATIARTVRSILEQVEDDVEVIVVDDGSDVDVTIALAPLVDAGHCRVIRQQNLGASVARNVGYNASNAPLVMFVDADDEIVEGSLVPFIAAALDSQADITISDFFLRTGQSSTLVSAVNSARVDFDERDRAVLQRLTLARVGFDGAINVGLLGAPWAKIYSREFLAASFGRDDLFTPGVLRGQDVLFNTEAFGRARTVHYFRSASYIYSVSAGSASHRAARDFVERVEALVEAVDQLIRRESWSFLAPAAAKMAVTLLDEGLQRRGRELTLTETRQLLRYFHFRRALRAARLRDFGVPGQIKLIAFRAGSAPTYALMKLLDRLRRSSP